jgi:hypothetical protein
MGVERERKSGMGWGRLGEAGRARSVPGMHPIQVTAPKCQEKCRSQRKLTEVSRPRAKFNGRLKLPGWPGKYGAAQFLGQVWLL